MSDFETTSPTVWILTDDRPGNRTQALGAARALGWPYAEKALTYTEKAARATPLLGATLDTLDEASRLIVEPPYPDLVIGVGRRSAPVARFIRQASGGRSRVVLIGRKIPAEAADLAVRQSYLVQPPDPRVLQLTLPLTKVDRAGLDKVRAAEPDPLAGLAAPRIALLVGGATAQYAFEESFAEEMARAVAAAAGGGGLAILTSRRTGAAATAALRRGAPRARLIEWTPDAAYNPFLACLANADLLVVTGESESMLAEAVAAGKPLTIYPLPARPLNAKNRLRLAIARASRGGGALARAARRLMDQGWISPRRDLADMHRALIGRGWGRLFDGTLNRSAPAAQDEGARLAERVAALMSDAR